jgi:outer membrane protein assembly factor BamB
VYGVSITERQIKWKLHVGSAVFSAPFSVQTPHMTVVWITTTAGAVLAIDTSSGQKLFEASVPGQVFSSPVATPSGGVLFGARDDHVYYFAPSK